MKSTRSLWLLALAMPMLQACSNPAPAAPSAAAGSDTASAPAPAAEAAAPAATLSAADARKACNLVNAAEMSKILGNDVIATPNDSTEGITACSYSPSGSSGHSAEIMISWGDGESTLKMVREMSKHDAAGDEAYKGIGDDAVYEGPAVVVRQGKDLVAVTVFGAADEPAAVKQIIDTAKARM